MKRATWPVTEIDCRRNGHGRANATTCLYCGSPLGFEHVDECVCRDRTVVVHVTIECVITAVESWNAHAIEFRHNESSWCADNAWRVLDHLFSHARPCMCGRVHYKYVREATEKDERECGVYIDRTDQLDQPEGIAPSCRPSRVMLQVGADLMEKHELMEMAGFLRRLAGHDGDRPPALSRVQDGDVTMPNPALDDNESGSETP